jgi:hypothetical protein
MYGRLSGRGKSPKWAFAGVLRATASNLETPRGRRQSPEWAFAGVLRATASALKTPRGRRRRCQIKILDIIVWCFLFFDKNIIICLTLVKYISYNKIYMQDWQGI